MNRKRIAIIGGGASGLTSIKACLEEGLEPICYEMQSDVGGLWRFHEEDVEGVPSVMGSTVIDTSKEMSAFSDFPPPTNFPNHMHNSYMIRYLEMYADNFNLRDYIKLRYKVLKVRQNEDYDSTGRYLVRVKSLDTGVETEELFEGVMICTGHHVYPNMPEFPGLEEFKGKVIHSHSYKRPIGFEQKNVVVVGVGNSGADVAVELSYISKKVYLSTRRGAWIVPLIGPKGYPIDAHYGRRTFNAIFNILPRMWVNWYTEHLLQDKFSHGVYNIKPKHRLLSQHPTVNGVLPTKIFSGTVVVKNDIHHFTADGVSFLGEEDKVYDCDAVVFATGYLIKFPFLDASIFDPDDNQCPLYKLMFPGHLKHPSLTFIGLSQPAGCIFPISDNQARWYARLMTGQVQFPSTDAMALDIEKRTRELNERYYASKRHTIQVDWIPYMDEIASQYGAKPNMWKLLTHDPKFFWICANGPCLPYQYRLQGPGAWDGAHDAILGYKSRVRAAFNTRMPTNSQKISGSRNKSNFRVFITYAFYLLFSYPLISMFGSNFNLFVMYALYFMFIYLLFNIVRL